MTDTSLTRHEKYYALAGVVVSVGLLVLATSKVDFSEMGTAIRDARPFPWLPLAISAYIAAMVVRAWRLRLLVSLQTDLPLTTAANIVAVGYGVNNILPLRLGEIARAYMLKERSSLRFVQSLTVTLLERVLDGVAMLALFALAIVLVAGQVTGSSLVSTIVLAVTTVAFGGVMLITAFAVLSPHNFARAIARSAGLLGSSWYDRGLRIGLLVASAMSYLRDPVAAGKIVALSLLTWLVEAFMFVFVFKAFGLGTHFEWALFAMTVTNLGVIMPSSPGYIGPWHFFCSESLVLLGVSSSVALSVAIIAHLTFFIPMTLWAVVVIGSTGVQWRSLIALKRSSTRIDASGGLPEGSTNVVSLPQVQLRSEIERKSRFYLALAEAIMPFDDVALSADQKERVTHDVVEMLQGGLNSLSNRLFAMLTVGLVVFRVLTRVRYVRGFCDLTLEQRINWVSAWADGRIPLFRSLFRPVRSLVMLAYFENPTVHVALDTSAAAAVEVGAKSS